MIPINIVLALVLSTLVSTNITLTVYQLHKRKKNSHFGGMTGAAVLLFLIIATVLTSSMLVYILGRLRIPKLRFDGFFKSDSLEVSATSASKDLTKFFVKIIIVNKRSEGNAELCIGLITIGNKRYRTVWEYDYAGNSFGKEALLEVFYIDKNHNTIN